MGPLRLFDERQDASAVDRHPTDTLTQCVIIQQREGSLQGLFGFTIGVY